MPPVLKSRYGQAAVILLIVFGIGRVLWGWGFVTAAFGLIVYLLIAIGIRVDEMAQDIRAIRDAGAHNANGQARLIDHLAQIQSILARAEAHLSTADTEDAIRVENPTRD